MFFPPSKLAMRRHLISETFARCSEERSLQIQEGQTKRCRRFPLRRLLLKPYFGHYSDMWVTFEVSSSLPSDNITQVEVTVEGCSKPLSFHLGFDKHSLDVAQSAIEIALKGMCLKFVYGFQPPAMNLNRPPSSLSFLCERMIVLNLTELNPSVLPSILFSHLNPCTSSTRDVFVKVWSGASSCPPTILRMRIKKGMLVAEFQWMIWNRLEKNSQFDLTGFALYENSSTEKLLEKSYLKLNQVLFHCIKTSIDRDSIIISLVGQDIKQIKVKSSMTLNRFQEKVRRKFSLDSASFLYFPRIFHKKHASHSSQVTMRAVLDTATVGLIDNKRRRLPIINGIPLNLLKYDKIDMYKLTISDLDLLSSHLVPVYEVTGPTIPIEFRALVPDAARSDFVLIADGLHAVSINLQWSVLTLLKYLEDVSFLPCVNLSYRGSILPQTELLNGYFHGQLWELKNSSVKIEFMNDVPKVTNDS